MISELLDAAAAILMTAAIILATIVFLCHVGAV